MMCAGARPWNQSRGAVAYMALAGEVKRKHEVAGRTLVGRSDV